MRKVVSTDLAPAAIGPYVQANIVGDFLYTSGQVPLDPKTGEIVGTTIEEQARRVLDSLKAIVEAADATLDQVVKTTVFIKDMNNFAKVNEIYAEYFDGEIKPSRSAVEVARLPKDVMIEIEAVAFLG